MRQSFEFTGDSFTPVDPVYYDIIESEKKQSFSKVYYFVSGIDLEEASGKITGIEKDDSNAEYLCFDKGHRVRIDRIITINGKPGPAYDEYDRYALACLDCNGGMD